jgi:Undecaprenyl-phosphate glucose phosphotransferase
VKPPKNNFYLTALVLFDLIILIFSYVMARYLVFLNFDINILNLKKIIIILFLIFILFITLEKFELSSHYRFRTYLDILKNILYYEIFLIAAFYVFILLNIYRFRNDFVLNYVIISFSIFVVQKFLIKFIFNILSRKGINTKNYLVVGSGLVAINFYKKIKYSPNLGINVIGFLDDDDDINSELNNKVIKNLIIDKVKNIESVLSSRNINNVIIALPMHAEDKIIKIVSICEKHGIKVELIPDYYKIISTNPSVSKIKGIPIIGIRNVPLENIFNKFIKRICDVVFAICGLIFCIPIFIIIIVGIKISSPGPIFFRQRRTGYKQKEFDIIKFRSMRINADSDKLQATKDDPRKTKFGDFLRRTNLDELPQLINILKGDMSVIGPRPHMVAHTKEFHEKYDNYLVRHWVKPGLTGWAQVHGWRGNSDIEMRLKYDIDYIENWTIWLDGKILFLTLFGSKVKENAF